MLLLTLYTVSFNIFLGGDKLRENVRKCPVTWQAVYKRGIPYRLCIDVYLLPFMLETKEIFICKVMQIVSQEKLSLCHTGAIQ